MSQMSKLHAYKTQLEALYPQLSLYADSDERAARMGEEEQWLADEAGQIEFRSWLDQLDAQHSGAR